MDLIDLKRAERLYDQVAGSAKNRAYDASMLARGGRFREACVAEWQLTHHFKRGTVTLSMPCRKPLKELYIDEALRLIDKAKLYGEDYDNVATGVPAQVARLMALPYTRELLPNKDGTCLRASLSSRGAFFCC